MQKDPNCAYCMEGKLVDAFGIKICDLSVSMLYLFREQSHPGRVIVAYKDHVSEMVELTPQERAAYLEDINRVAVALHQVFHPKKVNYGAYGDTGHHLHFHLVPKYEDGFEYGGTFVMDPKRVYLTQAEYQERIDQIRKALEG